MCLPGAQRPEEGAISSRTPVTVMSHHVGLWKSIQCSWLLSHFSRLRKIKIYILNIATMRNKILPCFWDKLSQCRSGYTVMYSNEFTTLLQALRLQVRSTTPLKLLVCFQDTLQKETSFLVSLFCFLKIRPFCLAQACLELGMPTWMLRCALAPACLVWNCFVL